MLIFPIPGLIRFMILLSVQPAWQSEILSQQAELEKLGVPSMFIGGDRHKQRKVVGALEGMMGD